MAYRHSHMPIDIKALDQSAMSSLETCSSFMINVGFAVISRFRKHNLHTNLTIPSNQALRACDRCNASTPLPSLTRIVNVANKPIKYEKTLIRSSISTPSLSSPPRLASLYAMVEGLLEGLLCISRKTRDRFCRSLVQVEGHRGKGRHVLTAAEQKVETTCGQDFPHCCRHVR